MARNARRSGPSVRHIRVGQTGVVNDDFLVQRADDEMILILLADPSGMGEPVHIHFLVCGLRLVAGFGTVTVVLVMASSCGSMCSALAPAEQAAPALHGRRAAARGRHSSRVRRSGRSSLRPSSDRPSLRTARRRACSSPRAHSAPDPAPRSSWDGPGAARSWRARNRPDLAGRRWWRSRTGRRFRTGRWTCSPPGRLRVRHPPASQPRPALPATTKRSGSERRRPSGTSVSYCRIRRRASSTLAPRAKA